MTVPPVGYRLPVPPASRECPGPRLGRFYNRRSVKVPSGRATGASAVTGTSGASLVGEPRVNNSSRPYEGRTSGRRRGNGMNTQTMVVVLVALVVLSAIAWAVVSERRTRQLRTHFGPEYD